LLKFAKYKGLHEKHHFIPMAMEVHGASDCDMDRFIREYAHFFHDRRLKNHLFLSFAFNFSNNVLILPFNVL
jgi:hypothetical protein